MPVFLSETVAGSVMDESVVTFVVNGAKQILGILTTPPLGIFLTIGVIGAVAGLTFSIVRTVKGRS